MESEVRSDSRLFRTLSRSLLQEGIRVRFRAQGRSMFPAIKDGEVIELEPASTAVAGDVLLIESAKGLRVHRVINVSDGEVVTRGDSCIEDDTISSTAAILGRVTRVIGYIGSRRPQTLRAWLRRLFRLG